MLLTRIISAAIAAGILIPALIFGGVRATAVLVALLAGLGVWELSSQMAGLKAFPRKELAVGLNIAVVACLFGLPIQAMQSVVVWLPLLILLIHLVLYNVIDNTVESAGEMMFVLGYATIPLGHAVLLARLDLGIAWVLFVLVVICLGDAGAYFAGKYYGKHRFSSRVSPQKTLEGLAGGVAGNFVGMLIMAIIVPGLPPLKALAQLTLLLAVAGPLGDLCASAVKRRLQIKDFGVIMPGHGGLMDRADSLIPAFPATYYFLVLAGHSVLK
jgi:phosphatidate cytidylyltransferase